MLVKLLEVALLGALAPAWWRLMDRYVGDAQGRVVYCASLAAGFAWLILR